MLKVRFAGYGGQGIILAGQITAMACLKDGYRVVQSSSYGAEARGGSCRSDVIVSRSFIHDLVIDTPDALVIMSKDAYEKYRLVSKRGFKLVDNSQVGKLSFSGEKGKVFTVPATLISFQRFRKGIAANMVMVGALSGIIGIPSISSLKESIDEVTGGYAEMNIKAVEEGYKYVVENIKEDIAFHL